MLSISKMSFHPNFLLFPLFLLSSSPLLTVMSKEDTVIHINKYSTALINISWMDPEKNELHTEMSEAGRFSTAGPATVSGVLSLAVPQDNYSTPEDHSGCVPGLQLTNNKVPEAPVIALLSRGGCVFEKKVEHAVAAGAAGLIIYNNQDQEELGSIAVSSCAIPVVFTHQWKGRELMQLVEKEMTAFITLEEGSRCEKIAGNTSIFSCSRVKDFPGKDMAEEGEMMHSWAVIIISASFLVLLVLSLGMVLAYYFTRFQSLQTQDDQERRACKIALKALNHVKVMMIKEVEEEKECMVCLEMMKKGEEIRHLPCDHKFHQHCIDTWLLNKRKCPLCKLNIVQHFGLLDYKDSEPELSVITQVS